MGQILQASFIFFVVNDLKDEPFARLFIVCEKTRVDRVVEPYFQKYIADDMAQLIDRCAIVIECIVIIQIDRR